MYSLYRLRARVDALLHKLARPVAIVRLRRLADEFSLQWTVAIANRQSPPGSHPFIKRVADAGFRLTTFMALYNYLERCRSQNTIPGCNEIIRSLLPWSAALLPIGAPATSYPDQE